MHQFMIVRGIYAPRSLLTTWKRNFSSWNSNALSREVITRRKKTLLVDGNNLLYDVYDPRCKVSWNEQAVGTTVRFIQRVREMLQAKEANRLAIFFDTPNATLRQRENTKYKPKYRKGMMPLPLRAQFPITKDVLIQLGLPVIQIPGIEADDLIASYTKASISDGYDVVIATNDTDMYQLIQSIAHHQDLDQNVVVYRPMRRQSIRETRVVKLLGGGSPRQQPEIRALCGDQRGKTPGIPGGMEIREAVILLNKHGGLMRMLRNLNDVDDVQLSKRLQNSISLLEQSYRSSKLNDTLPLPLELKDLDIVHPIVLDRSVLETYFGPDGAEIVFQPHKHRIPKHLLPRKATDIPSDDQNTTDLELDKC